MKIISTGKAVLSAFFIFLSASSVFGQLKCGTTEAMEELMKQDPSIAENIQYYEELIQQELASRRPGAEAAGPVYIIPIVFHILHEYGAENITDAQVLDQVNILNRDFRKTNPDTTVIIPLFKPIAADCEIEFRLATKDPDGNCTNGIDRIYTHKTNGADDLSKLNQWPPDKYLNVWVVKSIGTAGVAGYAYYPAAVDGVQRWRDGILILYSHIGSLPPTGSPYNSRSLTHEIGHYLNLAHPWGSNNSNNVACGDDNVNDTPVTKGSATGICNLNLSICDTPNIENVQNFMDYSYCSKMYTLGQKDRMRMTLSLPTASRSNLWSANNLIATGTDVPSSQVCVPEADFYADKYFVCEGAQVGFVGFANKAGATSWEWSMPDGNPAIATNSVTVTTYSTPSWKTVSLKVSNASGSSVTTRNNYVLVSPLTADFQGNYSDGFENQGYFNNYWIPVNNGRNASQWNFTGSVSFTGSSCISLNSYGPPTYVYYYNPPVMIDPGIGANDVDNLISPSFDMSWVTSMNMNFRLAYATRATTVSNITESLKIYYSLNCGQTWQGPFYTKQGGSLITAGHSSTSFTPQNPGDWRLETVALPPILNNKSNVRFKFEYKSGAFSNNLFIDDFNISGTVGLDDALANSATMNIFPNPTTGNTNLTYSLEKGQNIEIQVTDVLGHTIFTYDNSYEAAGEKSLILPSEGFDAGIYFIKMISDDKLITSKKLIVSH